MQIIPIVVAVEIGVLIYFLYIGVKALCDEIIATRTALLTKLKEIEQHLAVGFAKEIGEHNDDTLTRWADFQSAMKASRDPNMEHPRFVMTDEEGAMQLASELLDLGLTWEEAQGEVKRMAGGENLKETADEAIARRKAGKTETPPGSKAEEENNRP
jgi:hypothetical protein